MNLSYYLYKYPYKLFWNISNLLGKCDYVAFYCADPLDYEMFLHIVKYLPSIKIIAKNKKVKSYLKNKQIEYISLPAFPKAVIMGRQTPYKFPVKKIIKIGFDHGLYQFKRWTATKYYNWFNVYFVSSQKQVELAKKRGIKTTYAIGYPKLDNAFNGEYNEIYLNELKHKAKISPSKKTVIFTTTWNVAGLSAIDRWIDNLDTISEKYNVLVSVHTWTEEKYKKQLKNNPNIHFIEEYDATPYLMIADALVGDYSSIIGEFCAFNKPIITFKVPESDRTIPEIIELIKTISTQVNYFDELLSVIDKALINPKEKEAERIEANKLLFYKLDGKAGLRAAEKIKELVDL